MVVSLHLGTAFKLTLRTMPILLVRLGMNLVFWLISLVAFGALVGLAALLSTISPIFVWIIFFAGLIGFGYGYSLFYKYVLYMIKAAHVAVVGELLANGKLPDGVSQLQWGKQQVAQRFGQVSIMFVVDEMIRAVIGTFTSLVFNIASLLPGDTMSQLASLANRVIRFATNYIDEAVMARAFWRKDENIWRSAEQGVTLYAQAWKPLLKNAVALMILSYIPFVVVLILFGAPLGWLLSLISVKLAAWSMLILFMLAFLVKVAVGNSFAMVAMIAAYQRETANLMPDPAIEAQLSGMSNKFIELKERAMQPFQPTPAGVVPAPPMI